MGSLRRAPPLAPPPFPPPMLSLPFVLPLRHVLPLPLMLSLPQLDPVPVSHHGLPELPFPEGSAPACWASCSPQPSGPGLAAGPD